MANFESMPIILIMLGIASWLRTACQMPRGSKNRCNPGDADDVREAFAALRVMLSLACKAARYGLYLCSASRIGSLVEFADSLDHSGLFINGQVGIDGQVQNLAGRDLGLR